MRDARERRGTFQPFEEDIRGPEASLGTDALSVPAANDQWIAAGAIRRLIGAWAYGALAKDDRPSSAEVRRAIAVAGALAEIALENGRASFRGRQDRAVWEMDINPKIARLGQLAGYEDRDATAGLALLCRVGVVQTSGDDETLVRLTESSCEAAPGVVKVSWTAVRDALHGVGAVAGAMAAPLAVMREVALASGPIPDAATAPHVRYSVRDLEVATLFSRSTVSEALALLERAGLVVTEARRGQTLRCALTPSALGAGSPIASAARPKLEETERPARWEGIAVEEPQPPPSEPSSGSGAVRLGEFAGIPIYAPKGTPIIVECDENGQWSCRVGPYLKLGPV